MVLGLLLDGCTHNSGAQFVLLFLFNYLFVVVGVSVFPYHILIAKTSVFLAWSLCFSRKPLISL